jgi:uncharacterized protein (TIGR00290 family)
VCWSGGKDSCLALQRVLARTDLRVEALLTTVTADFDRISMHGVRRELLEVQAKALGVPLRQVLISRSATNDEYEAKMGEALSAYRARGIDTVVFGDLFLEDIRAYRERLLAKHGMRGFYPLWGLDTGALIRDFIAQGFKAALVCIDPARLSPRFAGRVIDPALLADLPADVDPCGENGEFHTFVFDGPIFRAPVRFSFGERVCRDSFWFCDLIPDRVEDMAC